MERVWSPVVATRGNERQIGSAPEPQGQAKTVALLCDWLPKGAHGKEGVSGSRPVRVRASESQLKRRFSFRLTSKTPTHDRYGAAVEPSGLGAHSSRLNGALFDPM
jgi:hypothetical protein